MLSISRSALDYLVPNGQIAVRHMGASVLMRFSDLRRLHLQRERGIDDTLAGRMPMHTRDAAGATLATFAISVLKKGMHRY
jgi:hypothetical protein